MRQLVVGILAHVDAGKTTLAEALLFQTGTIRALGRVDHGDSHLDVDEMERRRGITIFSNQASCTYQDVCLTLVDAPGHVDFSAEAERTLQALDCAVLVINASDGVQGHTATMWRLLEERSIPTFVFVNKMDLAGADHDGLIVQLHDRLSSGCFDASGMLDCEGAESLETVAITDEEALDEYLDTGALRRSTMVRLVSQRKAIPCVFGSALHLEGIEELLDALVGLTP